MLHFLRNIRRSLINSGSMRKYTLYAIGEIALVVIGILIALQVNNWNEERKLEAIELQYLEQLLEDLTVDTTYYNSRTEESQNVVSSHKELIQLMYEIQKNSNDVMELLDKARWNTEHLTIQNSMYTELTNSGKLNIFLNQELKKLLIHYYREADQKAKHISEFDEVSTRHLIELGNVIPTSIKYERFFNDVFENLPLFKEEWEFFNDPLSKEFQTMAYTLSIYQMKHQTYLNHYSELKKLAIQLMSEIQKEINSR